MLYAAASTKSPTLLEATSATNASAVAKSRFPPLNEGTSFVGKEFNADKCVAYNDEGEGAIN
jgi:hypothetical protein